MKLIMQEVELSLAALIFAGHPTEAHSPLLWLLQFTKAVEAKQVAQQEAERARFVVMKADQVRSCLQQTRPAP